MDTIIKEHVFGANNGMGPIRTFLDLIIDTVIS